MVAITFLGTAWLQKENGHTRMDIVSSRLKPKRQSILNGITSILGAVVCIIISWYGWKATKYSYDTNYFAFSELEVPMYPITFIISLGMFLLFIQFSRDAYNHLKRRNLDTFNETNQ